MHPNLFALLSETFDMLPSVFHESKVKAVFDFNDILLHLFNVCDEESSICVDNGWYEVFCEEVV